MPASSSVPPVVADTSVANLIVVEDDPTARAMLGAWLHTEGFRYELHPDAASARPALAERSFDLMICDVELPDTTGPELAASLGEPNAHLPVIFLTGSPTLETAMKSVRIRAVAYLVKPPDLDELRTLVQRESAACRLRRTVAQGRGHLSLWDKELAALELHLGVPESNAELGYLQVTVRNLVVILGQLHGTLAVMRNHPDQRELLGQIDLIGSLRRTVRVLEQTREHFKSRDLGELRKELDAVLKRVDSELGAP
ncbi:MAG: response regulator [Opitutaceae bacterium]|nr:response regulator [Opitutaceae bacterium]